MKVEYVLAAVLVLVLPGLSPPSGGRIVLDPAVENDRAYRFAAAELAKVCRLEIAFGSEARDGDIAIGGASSAVKGLLDSGRLSLPERMKADGFAIRQLGSITVVAGADARGDLYGALWLAERTRLDGKAPRTLECVREPAVAIREYVDGQGRAEPPGRGFEGWFQECLRLGINTIPVYSFSREYVQAAKAYRMNLMAGTSPFSNLPVDDLIAKYGDQVSEDGARLCPLKPKVWDAHREQLRELLRKYPEIDFVRASMGDLPEDYHVWDGCRGPSCQKVSKAEGLLRACQATWDVVVGEFDKTFFISSWGNPPETYPLNVPSDYRYIMEHLPDRGIISTVNNTQHDFYLISPYNPIIGMTDRPKDIYFQVTTEYAGAGFVPVYIGPMIRERLARALETGLTVGVTGRLWEGVGLWTRDVLWTRANMYALYRAAWEPRGDAWEWARDWAALTFGPGGAEELAEALCLSEEVARRAFWVHGFTGEKGPAYAITRRNIITDGTHYIRWAKMPHLTAYRQCQMRGKVQEALSSTQEVVLLRDRMMKRWSAASEKMRDAKLRSACERDFEHLQAVVGVLSAYQRALLNWCHFQDEGISTEERCRAAHDAALYARNSVAQWWQYRSRFDLYRDSGMTEMVGVYLRDCAALSARPHVVAVQPGKTAKLTLSVFNNRSEGLAGTIQLGLPKGWTATGKRGVSLSSGERKDVALTVTVPSGATQGDAIVTAVLVSGLGGEIERATVRVKVIALAGRVSRAGKPARPTTICPRASKAPAIDGVIAPGEWAADAAAWVDYPFRQDASGDKNIFAVNARWMWDDKFFYVAMDISDDALQPLGIRGTVYRADREKVTFDLDGDRRDDYDIMFVDFADGPVAWPLTVDGVLTSSNMANRARVEPLGRGIIAAQGKPAVGLAGKRPGGPGRVLEAAIPWSFLGGFKPELGKVIGFAVDCGDADSAGRLRAFLQWPGRPAEPEGPYLSWGQVDKPTLFADLVFTE
jgi:hypothetical protein